MMKKNLIVFFVVIAFACAGCVPTTLYNWGNYSNTLYHFRKDANDDTRDKHMAELEAIITGSTEHNKRVPPGVFCELGYMHAKKGNKNKAMELFALEKTTYPESAHFVNRLMESIKTVEETGNKTVEKERKS
ncbi:MAG TPA: DUF4810 domain-containing protein [Desulfobulbaceae bacterium]|nr:MAG: hypothetical protein A2520_00590 [Deltaproteobacteria bacterium RIFOXYD12_FULL_53_23]HCC55206.1 DUF4810 domain-containing protein [Desulfobulbaceae bacterium]